MPGLGQPVRLSNLSTLIKEGTVMKMKKTVPALVLAFAMLLGGCGKSQPAETAPAETVKPVETTAPVETEKPADPVLLRYQELLKAAPALEGEHPELEDASFTDEKNRELFGEHYDMFAVTDLNQDGIPELIASTVINFRWVPVSVFTYADNEAVLLKDPAGEAVNGTLEQNSSANGSYVTFICSENHIHSLWRGNTPVGEMEENHAYALVGTTLTEVDCPAAEGTDFADIAKPNTLQNVEAMTAG